MGVLDPVQFPSPHLERAFAEEYSRLGTGKVRAHILLMVFTAAAVGAMLALRFELRVPDGEKVAMAVLLVGLLLLHTNPGLRLRHAMWLSSPFLLLPLLGDLLPLSGMLERLLLFAVNLVGLAGVYLRERKAREAFLVRWRGDGQLDLDPPTGLPNAAHIMRLADQALDRARRQEQPLALMLIALDRVRAYRTDGGNTAVERAMQSLVSVVEETIRQGDRVGVVGDRELMVLLIDSRAEEGWTVGRRILDRLGAAVAKTGGQHSGPSASIGIAELSRDNDNLSSLIRGADLAVMSARQQGPNHIRIGGVSV